MTEARGPLSLLLEGLSRELYAMLCFTLGQVTRHKSRGLGTKHIRSPPITSRKIDVLSNMLHTIIYAILLYV